MQNICSQTIFRDWCELIVVDAASPEGEEAVVRRYMNDFPNIRYIRTSERIGIYEALNLAIGEAHDRSAATEQEEEEPAPPHHSPVLVANMTCHPSEKP